jgi:hypothetical protein
LWLKRRKERKNILDEYNLKLEIKDYGFIERTRN